MTDRERDVRLWEVAVSTGLAVQKKVFRGADRAEDLGKIDFVYTGASDV